jgi:hypothetical protein
MLEYFAQKKAVKIVVWMQDMTSDIRLKNNTTITTVYNLIENPLFEATKYSPAPSKKNGDLDLSPLGGRKNSNTPRFWKVEFDKVPIKHEPEDDCEMLQTLTSFEKDYNQRHKQTRAEFESVWKLMNKMQFNDIIAPNKGSGIANFYGGLHHITFDESWDLFSKASQYVHWDSTKKFKLLDIGHGPAYYLSLAILLGFDVLALDLPTGRSLTFPLLY